MSLFSKKFSLCPWDITLYRVRETHIKTRRPHTKALDWFNVTFTPDKTQLQTEGWSLMSRLNQDLRC